MGVLPAVREDNETKRLKLAIVELEARLEALRAKYQRMIERKRVDDPLVQAGSQKYVDPEQTRWTARRKAEVVQAIMNGALTFENALSRYDLTSEELLAWQRDYAGHGIRALRTTRLQQYRSQYRSRWSKK